MVAVTEFIFHGNGGNVNGILVRSPSLLGRQNFGLLRRGGFFTAFLGGCADRIGSP